MDKIKNIVEEFYSNEVILSSNKVSELRDKKNINIDHLKAGIKKYNEDNETNYELYESLEQGSVAMSTAIEPEYDDFDIDVAIIFEKDNIPSSTSDTKDLVINFLKRYEHYFKQKPKKKNNCMRIEYQDNYHIDFAIYRVNNGCYEHCGLEWTDRNPRSINNWFHNKNNLYDGKLRKITRLIKYFSKARKEWDICGGLIITILVEEALNGTNLDIDIDNLLLNVIKAISERISHNLSVKNPTNNQELIKDDKNIERLKNLKEKLDEHISGLNYSYVNNNEDEIKKKWNKFFKTDYFTSDLQQKNRSEDNEMFIENLHSVVNKQSFRRFDIKCQRYLFKDDNYNKPQVINCYNGYEFYLSKNRKEKICFSIDTDIARPYTVLWKVKNNGKTAIQNNNLRGEIYYGNTLEHFTENKSSEKRFENISFSGNHYVECYLIKNNCCIATKRFDVIIND